MLLRPVARLLSLITHSQRKPSSSGLVGSWVGMNGGWNCGFGGGGGGVRGLRVYLHCISCFRCLLSHDLE